MVDSELSGREGVRSGTVKAARTSFLRNAIAYSTVGVVGQVIKVFQEFVLRRLLLPDTLGIWNLAVVVQGFANTFDLGITTTAELEIAHAEGAGRQDDAVSRRSTTFWAKIAQHGVVAMGIVAYAAIFRRTAPVLTLAGLLAGSWLVLNAAVLDSMALFHRTSQRYLPLSRVLLLSAILSAVILPVGAYFGRAWGVLAAGLLGALVQAGLLTASAWTQGIFVRWSWSWSTFRRLVSYGLPFRVVDYPLTLFAVVDSMFVARFMGLEALALYSTAKIIFQQTCEVPFRFAAVFITRLYTEAGTARTRGELAEELLRFLSVSYLGMIPLVIVGVSCLAPFVFGHFLPSYAGMLPSLRILLLAIYFLPGTSVVRNFWLIDRRLIIVGVVNVVSLVGLAAISFLLFWLRGRSLTSVALGMVGGYAIFFACLMVTIGREVWGNARTVGLVAWVAVSLVYTSVVVRSLPVQPDHGTLLGDFGILALNLLKTLVLVTPLAIVAAWRARLPQYIQERLRRR